MGDELISVDIAYFDDYADPRCEETFRSQTLVMTKESLEKFMHMMKVNQHLWKGITSITVVKGKTRYRWMSNTGWKTEDIDA